MISVQFTRKVVVTARNRLQYKNSYNKVNIANICARGSQSLSRLRASEETMATKMVRGLKAVPYEERFKALGLYIGPRIVFAPATNFERRLRGDLIEVFKIMTDREKIDKIFNVSSSHAQYPVIRETAV